MFITIAIISRYLLSLDNIHPLELAANGNLMPVTGKRYEFNTQWPP